MSTEVSAYFVGDAPRPARLPSARSPPVTTPSACVRGSRMNPRVNASTGRSNRSTAPCRASNSVTRERSPSEPHGSTACFPSASATNCATASAASSGKTGNARPPRRTAAPPAEPNACNSSTARERFANADSVAGGPYTPRPSRTRSQYARACSTISLISASTVTVFVGKSSEIGCTPAPVFASPSAASSATAISSTSSTLRSDACVPRSISKMRSISSPKKSSRTGAAPPGG